MSKRLKIWRANWGLVFLVPFIACIVCLAHLASGSRADWDFMWCAMALLYMAAQMVKLILLYTEAGKRPADRADLVMTWKDYRGQA